MLATENNKVVVSTLPANAPNWMVILFLVHYLVFPKNKASEAFEHLVTRPQIDFRKALSVLALYSAAVIAIAVFAVIFFHTNIVLAFAGALALGLLVCLCHGRSIVIWIIRMYQARAAAEVRLRCKLKPSCSEYMISEVGQYGVFAGVRRGLDRVRSCGDPAFSVQSESSPTAVSS